MPYFCSTLRPDLRVYAGLHSVSRKAAANLLFNTALSIPAVVVGLTLYMTLSRAGPLGNLRLLFTQEAMIIGQILLCFPILVAMATPRCRPQTAVCMGDSPHA